MKRILLACLLFSFHALMAQEPDANAAWQQILMLNRPASQDKDAEIARLTNLEREADAYWQRYANDFHVWEAKVIVLQSRLDRAALEQKKPDLRVVEVDAKEIIDAESAPAPLRARAALLVFELHAGQIADARDVNRLPGLDAAVAELSARFPGSSQATQAAMERLEIYEQLQPGKVDALLLEYSTNQNPRIAGEARRRLVTKDLKKKPLDLKFTAVDGKEFDLAKWRGKVVLVDFWATWCGPCRMEMPNVVAAYKKLHDKGFEIVGISLDSNKDKLIAYAKEKEMTWPQYFDGQTWGNKISTRYGITGIPATWLVDKKGYVRLTDARSDLEGQVTKLLAE